MIIDISGIEYDFLPSVLWVCGILAIFIAMILVSVIYDSENWFGFGLAGFAFTIIFGVTLGIGVQAEDYVTKQEQIIVTEQLEAGGYDNIYLTGLKQFTASKDGVYVAGTLYQVGDYEYKVVEVPLD